MARSPTQLYAQAQEIAHQRTSPNSGAPFLGVVDSVQNVSEFMKVLHHGGTSTVRVLHPYVGSQHWHRVGPDTGQRVLLQVRQDSREPEASAYYHTDARDKTPELRAQAYQANKGLYRPIQQGEQEIVSAGAAQTFWSRRGILDSRAGPIQHWLDQDRLEAGARAPAHTRQGLLNVPEKITDEERFGVVMRSDDNSTVFVKYIDAPPASPSLTPPTVNASAASDPVGAVTAAVSSLTAADPAKEYLRVLTGKDGPIVDTREGHVTDAKGKFLAGKFGKNLRVNKLVYGSGGVTSAMGLATSAAGSGTSTWEEQVDENGNWYVGLPQTASEGIKFEIPAGKFTVKSGTKTASMMFDGQQGIMEMLSSQTGTLKADQTLKLGSQDVKLGMTDQAVHKLIKTQIYKNGSKGFTGGLSGSQLAESGVNVAAAIAVNLIATVFLAVSAAPLCPGVLVALMGRVAAMVPTVVHGVLPAIKVAKGGFGSTFTGAWDSYESSNVKNS